MVFQDTEPSELKALKQGFSFILSVRLCPAHGKEALALVWVCVLKCTYSDVWRTFWRSHNSLIPLQTLISCLAYSASALSETPSSQRFLLDFYFTFLPSDVFSEFNLKVFFNKIITNRYCRIWQAMEIKLK